VSLDTVPEPAGRPITFLLFDDNPLRLKGELDPTLAAELRGLKDRPSVADG
jgi:hypothetical protein